MALSLRRGVTDGFYQWAGLCLLKAPGGNAPSYCHIVNSTDGNRRVNTKVQDQIIGFMGAYLAFIIYMMAR